ncbi:ADP-ribosyl cyclase/cyclic ADP-ribose hydrolase 1-like isoform X3 [Engraulis encrasicolus]|uniref:ADP-ribosyl cyclase/cyclic ADP-ribose hydrolase 1-like isoform X3 n=1 Tax=Engraulis encrasicolus TaxID=184585 RepID=UPI002FD5E968
MNYQDVDGDPGRNKNRVKLLIPLCVIMIVSVLVTVLVLWLTLGTGSSGSLQATVMSRCETYLKDQGAAMSQISCEKIWESFKQAFVGKDPCDVPPESYDPLMRMTFQVTTCDRTLFWSQTKDMVHNFTAKRSCYSTLEDTLIGFILDGLTWCGRKNSQEVLTEGCPGWTDCVNNPVRSFWNRASAAFAGCAHGKVSVMLSGSTPTAFNPNSIFGSVEVKHFNSTIMSDLKVLLVTTESDTKTCESDASLKDLQKALDPKIKYQCEIVPQTNIQNCIAQPQIACGDCW